MSRNIRQKHRRDVVDSSGDEDYQGSELNWRSDNEWNEDSSIAGEVSMMSDVTEEQLEEEEGRVQKPKKSKKRRTTKPIFNLDDVGTDDDGESRHQEDIKERTFGRYSRTNGSGISDMSDIEDQIAEAQHKFMDDKQSLNGMMGLVKEVTTKGETLTKKASETSLNVKRDTIKKGVLSNDQISLFDEDDELSFRSYAASINLDDDQIPQRDFGKRTSGHIEYLGEKEQLNVPETFGLGHIEYLDEIKSNDSGSLISEQVDPSTTENARNTVRGNNGNHESDKSENTSSSEAEELQSEAKSIQHPDRMSLKSSKSNETFVSKVSNQPVKDSEYENDEEDPKNEMAPDVDKLPTELEDKDEEQLLNYSDCREFEEPECSKLGEKHLCCFINLGGGGDDGRENKLVNRLKKLKDDIANMRKELSLARQECKKESEEVAKLIEEAAARNKAADQNEIALPNSTPNVLLQYSSPNYTQEIVPSPLLAQSTILPGRTQVAIPTVLLEERLRTTRQNASSTYRNSLNELERMVEKEMASLKDSMTRLEPLNKIAAEWDAVQPMRDPKRTTYKSDYKLEMVTSEMRLQTSDPPKVIVQDIK